QAARAGLHLATWAVFGKAGKSAETLTTALTTASARRRLRLQRGFYGPGIPRQVVDGRNDNDPAFDDKKHPKRESGQQRPTIVEENPRIGFRVAGNSNQCRIKSSEKIDTQTQRLRLIPAVSFRQMAFRETANDDGVRHLRRSMRALTADQEEPARGWR